MLWIFIGMYEQQFIRYFKKKSTKPIKAMNNKTAQSDTNTLITAKEIREGFLTPSKEIIHKVAKAQYKDINRVIKTASKNGNHSVDFYVHTPQGSSYPLKKKIVEYISTELEYSGFLSTSQ